MFKAGSQGLIRIQIKERESEQTMLKLVLQSCILWSSYSRWFAFSETAVFEGQQRPQLPVQKERALGQGGISQAGHQGALGSNPSSSCGLG